MISFMLTTYVFLEYQNYSRYKNKREILNEYRKMGTYDENEMKKRINILCDDIINDHIEVDVFIKEMFRGVTDISTISHKEMYDAIYDNMYSSSDNHKYNDDILRIIKTLEEKLQINFSMRDNLVNQHITIGKDNILAWYRPLFLTHGLRLIKTPSEFYLKNVLGFERTTLKDGIVMWIKKGSKNCTVFIPSCIGGITLYPYFVKKLDQTNTIMIPEIPEMSWNNGVNIVPPNMSDIAHEITTCIIDNGVKSLNMIGHSFGTIVMNHIVNEQYKLLKDNDIKLNRLIYIEGLLFYAKVFSTLNTIEDPIHKVLTGSSKADITTMSLFQRDLYVKFYIKRCFNLVHSVLSGTTDCENECEIHALMGSDDNKFIAQDYVTYIEKRRLPIKYKVFDGCCHGAFVWNKEIQEHVLDLLKH